MQGAYDPQKSWLSRKSQLVCLSSENSADFIYYQISIDLWRALSLAAKQQLRTLELNAWQLFRLLRVRYPRSLCVNNLCSSQPGDSAIGTTTPTHILGGDNDKEIHMFCELFNEAIWLHTSWRVADCTEPIRYVWIQFQIWIAREMSRHQVIL